MKANEKRNAYLVKMLLVMLIVAGLFMIPTHKAISEAVGIWLLDEGKGQVSKDFSGKGNDGKLTGTVNRTGVCM